MAKRFSFLITHKYSNKLLWVGNAVNNRLISKLPHPKLPYSLTQAYKKFVLLLQLMIILSVFHWVLGHICVILFFFSMKLLLLKRRLMKSVRVKHSVNVLKTREAKRICRAALLDGNLSFFFTPYAFTSHIVIWVNGYMILKIDLKTISHEAV